jgi:hypothetical protein
MGNARGLQLPSDPAELMEYLRYLADHPGEIERQRGRRPLDVLAEEGPFDHRRPTDPRNRGRNMADYSSPKSDQDANYGSGLL